ncbi:MAG TPA: hypothetical protein ENH10_09615 [Bacteroidetes bacterium]|nr:hypothetical protein BMS3Bbin04_00983 [bacterium BMS3Bbin04]HDO66265.1 hypothetical protein [Bacteroidota bacterium]HEX05390.1 hypothetical protein [Bacteroidota bacterium]
MSGERLIRVLLILLGIPAIVLFLGAKSEYVMGHFTVVDSTHGDLSKKLKIRDFQVSVPPSVGSDSSYYLPGLADADILLIGDSFFRWHRGGPMFAEQLSGVTGHHAVNLWSPGGKGYPQRVISQLEGAGVRWSDTTRVLLVECIERNLVRNYSDSKYALESVSRPDLNSGVAENRGTAGLVDLLQTIRYRWFESAELNYQYLLQNSPATVGMTEFYNTMRYRVFDIMPGMITVYDNDPVMLFYEDTIDDSEHSYFYPHSDETVQAIAETLEKVQSEVLNRFNLRLIFLPVPNKISIAAERVTDVPYDMFVPRLCAELERRNVPTISLYELFRSSEVFPYHPTDTHWNQTGVEQALNQLNDLMISRGWVDGISSDL